jgi:hypothetical protein
VPGVRADGSERLRPAADAGPPNCPSSLTSSVRNGTEEVINALDAVACARVESRSKDDRAYGRGASLRPPPAPHKWHYAPAASGGIIGRVLGQSSVEGREAASHHERHVDDAHPRGSTESSARIALAARPAALTKITSLSCFTAKEGQP